ncbi:TetR/AcrR family transcriptional regulator [Microbacterium sp. HD4P20]|uniref:TetR/AcrR family transcriptional regulator n=1 Tax=Microbacterium sp. HD4P20 TaxID=2864874 RepID=UPI001C643758|nr:TetR/AcrR family transcriptional regulator [Microbacterium sp. HD4P20]MCP2635744.1 TetR/AcrR family transcriptional regulator [Microbacterium sp. HD4P20]
MTIRASTEVRLLDAADDLFFSRGIAATPVDAILERAGVSPATLYRGYASKEALLAATLRRRHEAWLQVWDDAVARQHTDEERLLAVFDALDEFRTRPLGSRWCAFLGSAAEYADAPAEVAQAVHDDTRALRSRLAELAQPLCGDSAGELAEQLLLVVTGDLAMRLRDPAHTTAIARRIAAVLVAAAREKAELGGSRRGLR